MDFGAQCCLLDDASVCSHRDNAATELTGSTKAEASRGCNILPSSTEIITLSLMLRYLVVWASSLFQQHIDFIEDIIHQSFYRV
jgi:hypothetical protein